MSYSFGGKLLALRQIIILHWVFAFKRDMNFQKKNSTGAVQLIT